MTARPAPRTSTRSRSTPATGPTRSSGPSSQQQHPAGAGQVPGRRRGAGTANGTTVDLYPCNGTGAQAWDHQSNGELREPELRQVPRRHRLRRLRHPGPDLGLRRHLQPAVEPAVKRRLLAVLAAVALMARPRHGRRRTSVPQAATGATGPITGYQGLCLDDRSASTADFNPIQVYTCNGTNAQQWTVESSNTLQVLGKCLDVDGGRHRQRHHRRPLHLQRHRRPGLGPAVQRRTAQPQLRQVPRRHRLRRLRHPGPDLGLRRHLQPAVDPAERVAAHRQHAEPRPERLRVQHLDVDHHDPERHQRGLQHAAVEPVRHAAL